VHLVNTNLEDVIDANLTLFVGPAAFVLQESTGGMDAQEAMTQSVSRVLLVLLVSKRQEDALGPLTLYVQLALTVHCTNSGNKNVL
jgi:hypothetical protein